MVHLDSLIGADLGPSALTIGAFDGVHRGHQQILEAMRAEESTAESDAVVLTFYPHPSVVLHGRRPSFYLTSPQEKAELLGGLGAEIVITHPFSLALSKYKAAEFLDLLQANVQMRSLWVGPDFALGHEREGSVHFLRAESERRGFKLHVVEPLRLSGEVISSTRIRETLRSGDVARAATYLGRPFSIPGEVEAVSGETATHSAEVGVWEERAYPRAGAYACIVSHGASRQRALVLVQPDRALTPEEAPRLMIRFSDPVAVRKGETVRIHFYDRVRREAKGSIGPSDSNEISSDLERVQEVLDRLQ